MIGIVLVCLIESLGDYRFRVREATHSILARAFDTSSSARLALVRAEAHRDPEVRRRATSILETWATVWPTDGGEFPRAEFLIGEWWAEFLGSDGEAVSRLLSVSLARDALFKKVPRWRVINALDRALRREKGKTKPDSGSGP